MNGEEPRQELQKLAELRHKVLEAYDPSQEIGPPRPKKAPGERYDPQTPPEQRHQYYFPALFRRAPESMEKSSGTPSGNRRNTP
jgi:hypothetical protein